MNLVLSGKEWYIRAEKRMPDQCSFIICLSHMNEDESTENYSPWELLPPLILTVNQIPYTFKLCFNFGASLWFQDLSINLKFNIQYGILSAQSLGLHSHLIRHIILTEGSHKSVKF